MPKHEYIVNFTDSIFNVIEELKKEENITAPEVLRRAVALYHYVHIGVTKERGHLLLADEDYNSIKEVTFGGSK